MTKKLRLLAKNYLPVIAVSIGVFAFIGYAQAQGYLGPGWNQYLGDVPGHEVVGQGSGEDLAIQFILNGVGILKYVIGAGALVYGLLYAASMITARGDEEVISKQRKNFVYLLLGFLIFMAADGFAKILNPVKATSEQLINFKATQDQFRLIASYLKWLFGSVIMLIMVLSVFRLVSAHGETETIDKEKKHLTWGTIGMLVILLADNIVNSIYFINEKKEAVAAPARSFITQLGGIIQLILMFLGPAAILFTIYAGFTYLTAMDNQEQADKGKRMIIAGITGIIIIYAAYALVNTLVGVDVTPVTDTTAIPQ
jgi:hypothetical protein